MTILEITLTLLLAVSAWIIIDLRNALQKEAKLRERQHLEDDMNFQLVNARYLKAIEELAETKAELEQYKNHESGT
jgi:hypothetical protein